MESQDISGHVPQTDESKESPAPSNLHANSEELEIFEGYGESRSANGGLEESGTIVFAHFGFVFSNGRDNSSL
jgi:hypothetical protein